VALAALAAGSDVLIRSAGADSTRAPIGAPPPFFYVEAKVLGMALAKLGRKTHREDDVVYPVILILRRERSEPRRM
jgi:hypothetical protein